jgi:hypothetical protein
MAAPKSANLAKCTCLPGRDRPDICPVHRPGEVTQRLAEALVVGKERLGFQSNSCPDNPTIVPGQVRVRRSPRPIPDMDDE